MLTLLDSHQPAWDRLVSSHLLGLRSSTSPYFPSSTSTTSSTPSSTSGWSLEMLQNYFSHIQSLRPGLSGELALGFWQLASGTWLLALGSRHLAPVTWHLSPAGPQARRTGC